MQDGQVIGLKTLADVVEALIGVYFLHGDMNSALKAMNWLQVPIPFPEKVPEVVIANVEERMQPKSPFSDHDIDTLEKKIAYQFRCKSLLVSAFDFGDEIIFNEVGAARGSFEFQRLEFLGEVIRKWSLMWFCPLVNSLDSFYTKANKHFISSNWTSRCVSESNSYVN